MSLEKIAEEAIPIENVIFNQTGKHTAVWETRPEGIGYFGTSVSIRVSNSIPNMALWTVNAIGLTPYGVLIFFGNAIFSPKANLIHISEKYIAVVSFVYGNSVNTIVLPSAHPLATSKPPKWPRTYLFRIFLFYDSIKEVLPGFLMVSEWRLMPLYFVPSCFRSGWLNCTISFPINSINLWRSSPHCTRSFTPFSTSSHGRGPLKATSFVGLGYFSCRNHSYWTFIVAFFSYMKNRQAGATLLLARVL